jgi:hypothetical protein
MPIKGNGFGVALEECADDGQIKLMVVGHHVVQGAVFAVGGVVNQTGLVCGRVAALVEPLDGKGQGL